jgi:hypothetical protein
MGPGRSCAIPLSQLFRVLYNKAAGTLQAKRDSADSAPKPNHSTAKLAKIAKGTYPRFFTAKIAKDAKAGHISAIRKENGTRNVPGRSWRST